MKLEVICSTWARGWKYGIWAMEIAPYSNITTEVEGPYTVIVLLSSLKP